MGIQAAAEKGMSGAGSRATGRYLQQPEGAEALEGQRRDALQGVVAEDPAEGKQEETQHRQQRHRHHCTSPQPTPPPHITSTLGTTPHSSAGWQPGVACHRNHTYRVVSWLMLVKEELLRELILLLLRSLENRNPRDWSQPGPFSSSLLLYPLSCNGAPIAAWHQGTSRAVTQVDGSNTTITPWPYAQHQQRL